MRLRPVLTVDKERMIVGRDGLPMGADHELTIRLLSPSGTEEFTNSLITGNLSVIGIVSQQTTSLTAVPDEQRDAERLLFEETNHYIDRWNKADDELASLMRLAMARPIPTVVTIGGLIDVTYLLDTPHGFTWKGVYCDADLRGVETVLGPGIGGQSERHKTFRQLSSLQGSVLENRIFEDDFQVESISTAKLFQIVNTRQTPTLVTIDQSNIGTVLPALPFADEIKQDITAAVTVGDVVRISQTEVAYRDWTGVGYLKEDPATGASGVDAFGHDRGWKLGGCTGFLDIPALIYPFFFRHWPARK